jgi:nitrite reductase/ring-hydroxylating ferredoxin subunit
MQKLGLAVIMVMMLLGCGKGSNDYIPSVPVNLQLPMSDPRISKLNSVGGAVTLNGYGVAGLLLYRNIDGSVVAYDRCSSYQPEKQCAVTIDDTGFTATDPCSGSKFSLTDGSPVKAPASRSLRMYQAYIANFQLFVYN